MIAAILSLLGVGGIGAALIFVPGLAKLLGKLLGSIPPRVVWALLAMAAIFGAVWWHNHAVEAARTEGVKAGRIAANGEWKDAFAKMRGAADDFRRAYEIRGGTITTLLGDRHAQNLADIAAHADDLRLRGPGAAAACPRSGGDPGLAGRPGAQGGPAPQPDAPGPGVPPDQQFAIVPWGWLVRRGEEHDSLLDEVKTWRSWHDQQGALHAELIERLRRELPRPEFGNPP
jgi:hypothetical protein